MQQRSLEDFVEATGGRSLLRIEHDFGEGYVRLRTSEAERRQAAQDIRNSESIVLELLRNSRDAHAGNVFVALSRNNQKRSITVIDDGDGIPRSMHEHVFEPRVTSKLDSNHMDPWGMHGRGMALYSIRVNSEIARIEESERGLGCSIGIVTDIEKLPERTDQSSFPIFNRSDDGVVNIRGPRNMLRTACEFAIESRNDCSVYVGSPVEVASTIYAYGISTMSASERAFCRDIETIPIVKRLATSADPSVFSAIASGMGLDVSERSARRIMDGEIEELESMLDRIAIPGRNGGSGPCIDGDGKRNSKHVRAKGFKLDADDVNHIKEAANKAFSDIAASYYLNDQVEIGVRVQHGRIMISIPLVEET